jgi:hypothetical protein
MLARFDVARAVQSTFNLIQALPPTSTRPPAAASSAPLAQSPIFNYSPVLPLARLAGGGSGRTVLAGHAGPEGGAADPGRARSRPRGPGWDTATRQDRERYPVDLLRPVSGAGLAAGAGVAVAARRAVRAVTRG